MRRSVRNILTRLLLLTALAAGSLKAAPSPPGDGGERHDFHVSITDIHYNADHQSLEISVKIFTDDLEDALEALGAPKLRLGTPQEDPSADTLCARYLENRLQISIGGKKLSGNYLGKELESDATWCYIEITGVALPRAMLVSNRLLLERFDDQSNLVHLEVAGKKRSLLLRKGNEAEKVEF